MFQITGKRIMPPKRDKDKDRVRKAQKRAQMTDEEKEFQRKANRERMAAKRESMPEEKRELQRKANKERMAAKRENMPEGKRELQRKENKERMAKKRSEMSFAEQEKERAKDRKKKSKEEPNKIRDLYVDHEREFNRLYRIKVRENQSKAEHEYEKTYNLLCMRKLRSMRNGKQHLLDNVDARKGMRLLKEEGRLKPYSVREREKWSHKWYIRRFGKMDDVGWWSEFTRRGVEFSKILEERNPEMFQRVKELKEQRRREEEEKRAKEIEREERGEWRENPADLGEGDVYWTGINPPDESGDSFWSPPPDWEGMEDAMTDEEWREMEMQEYTEMHEAWKREDREKRNEIARQKYKELKEKLLKPIEMPKIEMSEYEKIRERNIEERNAALREAMKAAGYTS